MTAPLSVIVLAAGLGKRMRSDLPKVLQPLAGRPLLAHVLASARALSPAAIHVVHGHGAERVRTAFPDADLDWVLQAEQLGTGHAVLQAAPRVPDDHLVLVLYGDVPLMSTATLARLLEPARAGALAVLTAEYADPSGYGRIVRDARGALVRIVEERDASEAERAIREVNTGLIACPAARLKSWLPRLRRDNAQGEYYLTDCVALAVADGVAVVAVCADSEEEAHGINDRLQLARAESLLRARRARALMEAGVTLADPARLDVRGEVTCGRDVYIDVDVILEGRVTLGDRVRIGPFCLLRDVSIAADTEVFSHSRIEEAEIGRRCRIGPYARIRPATRLEDEVHVGNFVEIKKSELGTGAKANHLAYLGDASVGRDVNVGAGTITCNYDGVNKHRTVIQDGAFIGSNTSLVAPVVVGAGATIGAGSVVTRDAPAEALTVARAKQVTVPGWKRPRKK